MTPNARQLKPAVVVLPPVITASSTLVRLGVTSAAAHNAHDTTTYAGIVAVTDVRTTIGAVMTARLRHKPLNDLQVTVATSHQNRRVTILSTTKKNSTTRFGF
jgi:chitodextrinase